MVLVTCISNIVFWRAGNQRIVAMMGNTCISLLYLSTLFPDIVIISTNLFTRALFLCTTAIWIGLQKRYIVHRSINTRKKTSVGFSHNYTNLSGCTSTDDKRHIKEEEGILNTSGPSSFTNEKHHLHVYFLIIRLFMCVAELLINKAE